MVVPQVQPNSPTMYLNKTKSLVCKYDSFSNAARLWTEKWLNDSYWLIDSHTPNLEMLSY